MYNKFVVRLKNTLVIKKYFQFYEDFTHFLNTDKKFNEYYYKNKKLGSDPAKYFEKKFYKKFNTNDNIENIIKINYSPIYKLSHKNKLTINNTIYLYKLFKYINIDICSTKKKIQNKILDKKREIANKDIEKKDKTKNISNKEISNNEIITVQIIKPITSIKLNPIKEQTTSIKINKINDNDMEIKKVKATILDNSTQIKPNKNINYIINDPEIKKVKPTIIEEKITPIKVNKTIDIINSDPEIKKVKPNNIVNKMKPIKIHKIK